tara:strand:- start:1348 stop:1836 length:489 start_codon:yes stop_codon:yes gene_type:complete
MLIKIKNKGILKIKNFIFKCSIGKNGIKKNKIEGDKTTPKGTFSLGPIYYRNTRVKNLLSKIKKIKIKKNMGWCNDSRAKEYNSQIILKKNIKSEKLYRKDHKYDAFLVIKYNSNPVKKNKGSAIFLHLTKNYKPTAGCIAINKNDFLKLAKVIGNKAKIKI